MNHLFELFSASDLYGPHIEFSKQFYLEKVMVKSNYIVTAHNTMDLIIDAMFKHRNSMYKINQETYLICKKESSLFFNKLLTLNELDTMCNLILNGKNDYVFDDRISPIKRLYTDNDRNLPFSFHKNFQSFNFHRKI